MRIALFVTLAAAISFISAEPATAQQSGQRPRLEPVYPAQPSGLTWVEAEDAVSTNFSSDATLDYGSSAFRFLQLNKEGQSKSAPFYAEYSFAVDAAGTWSLWMGGTPPGPRDELEASFVSPVRLSLDGGAWKDLYREDVTVNERYSTGNYWFAAKSAFELSPGIHTIRFEVSERRRYDSRYYFYLDAFFLLRSDSPVTGASFSRDALPDKFPGDLSDTRIDQSYYSIPRYEYLIQSDPKNPERYLLLAQVYNLIGDNGSAVKTLARGRVVAGDDIRFTLQMAKSRIWSGEIDEGLRLYGEYLSSPDADPSVWAEAAKLSAWLMRYQESESLYARAVQLFPDDDNLRVNQALTYLWQSKVKEGERLLAELWAEASVDPDRVSKLGEIFVTSGYPDKAIKAYADGIEAFPERLDMYFSLARLYVKTNRQDLAAKTLDLVRERFVPSERLSEYVASVERESSLRRIALDGYRKRLETNPDDLGLRQELIRAYYWNGMLGEALEESSSILVNKMYAIFGELDGDLAETYRLLDLMAAYRKTVLDMPRQAVALSDRLRKDLDALRKSEARNEQALKGKDAKRQEKAAQELEAATTTLAGSAALAAGFVGFADEVLPGLSDYIKQAAAESNLAAADNAMREKLAPWTWDKAAELRFLSAAAASNPLAWHCAARILALDGAGLPPYSAARVLPANELLKRQATLWSTGSLAQDELVPADWYLHGEELGEAIGRLSADRGAAEATVGAGDPAAAEELLRGLEEARVRSAAVAAEERAASDALLARARARMAVRIYQYDDETQQDRREIADIHLRLDDPAKAVAALARVRAINPSDIASTFTLGRALEMSGDWRGAMDAYGTVYGLDPRYASAVSSYNRLAGTYAPSLGASVAASVDADSSDSAYALSFRAPLDGATELLASLRSDHRKRHAPAAGSFPESSTLRTLEVEMPIGLGGSGARLVAIAGGTVQNKLDDFLPASVADFTPETIAGYAAVAPRLGAGAGWSGGPWSVSALYRFNQLDETFYADRDAHYEHAGKVEASFYLDTPSRAFARSLSGSASAGLSAVFAPVEPGDFNWITSADAELAVGNVLGRDQAISLRLSAAASWNDSTDPSASDYYAPSKILTIKGGPALGLRFGKEDGAEFLVDARLWPGLYSAAWAGRLSIDGELSARVVRRGAGATLSLIGAWTDSAGSAASYWSGTVRFAVTVPMGDYIIP